MTPLRQLMLREGELPRQLFEKFVGIAELRDPKAVLVTTAHHFSFQKFPCVYILVLELHLSASMNHPGKCQKI